MARAACGAGNAYLSGAPDFTSGFHRGSCCPKTLQIGPFMNMDIYIYIYANHLKSNGSSRQHQVHARPCIKYR